MISKEIVEGVLRDEFQFLKQKREESLKRKKALDAADAIGGLFAIARVADNIEVEANVTLVIGRESEAQADNLSISPETTRQPQ